MNIPIKKKINNNYYNWDISNGDYIRDPECTSTHQKFFKKQLIRKRLLKLTGLAGLAILIITAFAYLIF